MTPLFVPLPELYESRRDVIVLCRKIQEASAEGCSLFDRPVISHAAELLGMVPFLANELEALVSAELALVDLFEASHLDPTGTDSEALRQAKSDARESVLALLNRARVPVGLRAKWQQRLYPEA
jgi:hypothetical protein